MSLVENLLCVICFTQVVLLAVAFYWLHALVDIIAGLNFVEAEESFDASEDPGSPDVEALNEFMDQGPLLPMLGDYPDDEEGFIV